MTTQPPSDYSYAQAADRYAASALRWARPLIILGWVIVVGALAMLAFGILVTLLTVTSDGSGFVATGTLFITAGFSVVALLQGAALLMVGSYVRMRASWTRHKIGVVLGGAGPLSITPDAQPQEVASGSTDSAAQTRAEAKD